MGSDVLDVATFGATRKDSHRNRNSPDNNNFQKQRKRFRRAFAGLQEILQSGLANELIQDVLGQELETLGKFGPQFIRQEARLREQAIESDPVLREQRAAALDALGIARSQLEDLEGGGLPADVERSILERTRTAFAARGLEASPVGATGEAVRLLGGEEAIRNQRLNSALGILSGGGFGTAAPPRVPGLGFGPSRFLPGQELTGQLGGQAAASRQLHESLGQQGFQNRMQVFDQIAGTGATAAGLISLL